MDMNPMLIPLTGSIPIRTAWWLPTYNQYAYSVVDTRKEVKAGDEIHVMLINDTVFMSDKFFDEYTRKLNNGSDDTTTGPDGE